MAPEVLVRCEGIDVNHDPTSTSTSAFGSHCGNNQATQMTLDRGYVHLTVDEYSDGSLRPSEARRGLKLPNRLPVLPILPVFAPTFLRVFSDQ